MSYQSLNIVIREAKLTDFLTDLAAIFNTNDVKLKSEIEKIVNGFQLNSTTGVMGEADASGIIPINQINARTLFMVLPGTPSTGWKMGFKNAYNGAVKAGVAYESTAIEPWSVSFASDVYGFTMGTQSAGYRGQFDRLTVDTVMSAMFGRFTMMQISDSSGLLDVACPAQFRGIVSHGSGHKESIEDSPILMQLDGTTLYCEIALGRTTAENVLLHLQFDSNGYNAGWVAAITNIEIRLVIDPSLTGNSPLSGQVFNFMLKAITDATNNPITVHPDVDIVIKAAETVAPTPDFEFKNFGADGIAHTPFEEIVFIPKAADITTYDSLDTYASNVSFIYNAETLLTGSIYSQTNMLYVRNKFSKE